jgi:hypothetical protein
MRCIYRRTRFIADCSDYERSIIRNELVPLGGQTVGVVETSSWGGVRLKIQESKLTVTDFSHTEPAKETFSWIKQTLDPSASYIVFENDLKQQGGSIFDPAHIAYTYLEREKFVWQQVIDMDKSREYLVIRMMPGNEEKVLGRIMGYGFPENTIYYIYKAKEVRK